MTSAVPPSAASADVCGRVFNLNGMYDALDEERQRRGLSWFVLADELWDQSVALNVERGGSSICGGAIKRLKMTGAVSCQYALFVLRWLERPPEDFLARPALHHGEATLPSAGPEHRLRWDLAALHGELNAERQRRGLTWSALATELSCTPGRLINLRTARLADMELTMRGTQWLREPAATFIHPCGW